MNSQEKVRIFNKPIPLWVLVLVLGLASGTVAALLIFPQGAGYLKSLASLKDADALEGISYGPNRALANGDFFAEVQEKLITDKTNFIQADLSSMKLTVYKEGVAVLEVPIETKGREGSWWETPAGLYKIDYMAKNHFSSIGHVYQPYSMAFQGNFFIHGWPYYEGGKPVSSAYSGGCIRLTDENAQKVYELATKGMPVLVFEKDFARDDFVYEQGPELTASSYLVADLKNNALLMEKDITTKAPIASVTKLVTGLVAAEYINLDKTIAVREQAIVPTSKARLTAGQNVRLYDLLFPLLMESSNEAAMAMADQLGRERFVQLMNQKATSIGMKNSTFADASGASDGNVSTPQDLFALAKYLYNNRSFLLHITSDTVKGSAYGDIAFTDLSNFNKIPTVNDTFIGGKIGKTTSAGETYLGVYEINVNGEKRPVVVVLLHSTDLYGDMGEVFSYLHRTYGE